MRSYAAFFYNEKLEPIQIGVLTASVIGISFFLDFSGGVRFTGVLLAGLSGLTYAYYMVSMDKKGLKNFDPYLISFYLSSIVSLFMLFYHIPTRQIVFHLPAKALFYTFLISICTSVFAVALLQLGIRYLSASTAAIFCLFEPVSSSFAGTLFLGEALTPAKPLGSILILGAAGVLSVFGDKDVKYRKGLKVHEKI